MKTINAEKYITMVVSVRLLQTGLGFTAPSPENVFTLEVGAINTHTLPVSMKKMERSLLKTRKIAYLNTRKKA